MLHRLSVWAVFVVCLFVSDLFAATQQSAHQFEITSPSSRTASPAMAEFVEEVVNKNPRVQAARSALDASLARERAAGRPLYNPALELDTENTVTEDTTLGLSQTIDWGDKRDARTQVASFELAGIRAELAGARLALGAELLSALGQYQAALELERLTGRRADLMQDFSALGEQRYRAGDLGQVDLELARLAAIEAKLRQAQTKATLSEAEQSLIAVVGESRSNWPALTTDLPVLNLAETDIDNYLMKLPAVQAQLARVAAAKAIIQLRARERKPDPTISLRGGREEDENLVGLSLSVPLFVRNSFRAEVDAASADLIATERNSQDAYRRARAQLVSASGRYRLTREAWVDWQQSGQTSLDQQTELLQRIWRAGELGTTDYLVQLNQALATQTSAIELLGSLWQAWSDWLAAAGQLDPWLGTSR